MKFNVFNVYDLEDVTIKYGDYAYKGSVNHVISSKNCLSIQDVKVFPNMENPRVVQCRFNHCDSIYKAVCCKEDTFDIKKGLFVCIAKYFDSYKELTPEGIEHKAKELTYKKEYVNAVDKAIKEMNRRLKQEKVAEEEKARIERKKQKNIAKKKARMERKAQKEKDDMAMAIMKAMEILKESKDVNGVE